MDCSPLLYIYLLSSQICKKKKSDKDISNIVELGMHNESNNYFENENSNCNA